MKNISPAATKTLFVKRVLDSQKLFIRVLCIALVLMFGATDLLSERLQPGDLTYLGAFRLPDPVPGSDVRSWAWGGFAMTYYPGGDPGGANDGYPGSIFGCGHAWQYQVSEISIPTPVISASKNLNQLNTASTIQSFQNILGVGNLEMPRAGLAYLPAQPGQSSAKLYFSQGYHLMDEVQYLSHGWFELTLSNPQTKGMWRLDAPHASYNSNDYMFEIPASWAASNTPGKILATGRFRDGGWSGQGPALYAISPWTQGNPPANGASLDYVELLRYTSTEDFWEDTHTMNDYHHSDEWSGAAWLSAGNKSAVVFVGTKGIGDCWYGNQNGPCLECNDRGWWSTGFVGQFIFYDPADLAKVAKGAMQSYQPQPYATLNIDQYLYHISSSQQWYHLGAACFDRDNGLFYVFEPYVDDDKPIVHVWKVSGSNGGGGTGSAKISLNRSRLNFGAVYGNTSPVDRQTFSISNSGAGDMSFSISDNASWLSCSPTSGSNDWDITVSVSVTGLSPGQYNGTITITSADASNTPQTVSVVLNVYNPGASSVPFGNFATPLDNTTVRSSIAVTGWVLDDVGIDNVKLYRQENGSMVYIGDAVLVEGSRPDVEQSYPHYPFNYKAGWGYMLLTNFFPGGGNGTFVLSAAATDIEGNSVTLGSKTITCDNANAVKPFGAIDTPVQGGIAAGGKYVNFGWVLTPLPNSIPTDGSTIDVWIDGVNVGNPTYNVYRSDIASLFPGYANSDGAIGYFYIDTTTYENGVHTIQWTASDSAGNTDGIGSRYFTIRNSGAQRAQAKTTSLRSPFKADPIDTSPVLIRKGYGINKKLRPVLPNESGINVITLPQLERLELRFPAAGEVALVQPLPVGATLDGKRGIFYWQPGPAFLGNYPFTFIISRSGKVHKRRITINIPSATN
jgi:hypothetical protein